MGVETLRLALTGIFANKLRSGLTILGMTIGVASVTPSSSIRLRRIRFRGRLTACLSGRDA